MPPASGAIKKAQDLLRMGMIESALGVLAEAAKKNPKDPDAAYYHGMVLVQSGRTPAGVEELTRAHRLRPGEASILVALGNALMLTEQADAAAQRHREAIKLHPKGPSAGPAKVGLTLALLRSHQVEEAIEVGREAVAAMPEAPQAWGNFYSALRDAGRMEEGIAALREATRRLPGDSALLSHLIAALNYSPATDPGEAKLLAERFGRLLGPEDGHPFANSPNPERPLRVGLISSDLRTHSVAFFVEPLLRGMDHERAVMIAYSTSARVSADDPATSALRARCAEWHEVGGLLTEDLVRKARSDAIDVIVELNGHTSGHRLAALAKRLAPVQVTYLGYPGTTGVPAIDARLVDAITDPWGSEAAASELLIRLPGSFLCYAPMVEAGSVGPPPSISAGTVTFGSFNSMPKMTPRVLDTWARVLAAVPGSTILLKNRGLGDPRVAARVRSEFAGHGIDPERVRTMGQRLTQADHLREYAQVDIALDTFPYSGTTTTCEAMWMGVPVVSLAGRTHAGRVGESLLTSVGLSEFIGRDEDDYVRIATALAGIGEGDRARLAALRAGMRERMGASRLMDAGGFARAFEDAIRALWRQWCQTRRARSEQEA